MVRGAGEVGSPVERLLWQPDATALPEASRQHSLAAKMFAWLCLCACMLLVVMAAATAKLCELNCRWI